ncbi:MAG: ABC transporter ATP-binding protein [Caldilineales bacterium]
MEHVIEVRNLRKSYGQTVAVDDISFQVGRGEIFAVVGPNGAGKTTTVESIIGLRKPDSGAVSVLGLDPQREGFKLRERIGVQLQQAAIADRLKVWEALDLFAAFYPHTVSQENLLEQWGLTEKRNTAFAKLSGGQKQRLFIALALLNDPEVVFLDELTTGLDPQARRNTWDMVREIRERGKTVMLVTHFMDEAEYLADRVAIIDGGQLIALDTPQALIAGLNQESRVHFTTTNGFDPASLRQIEGVSSVQRDGNLVTVFGSEPLMARVATRLAESHVLPSDLRQERTTLEDVFLARTGRALRN